MIDDIYIAKLLEELGIPSTFTRHHLRYCGPTLSAWWWPNGYEPTTKRELQELLLSWLTPRKKRKKRRKGLDMT